MPSTTPVSAATPMPGDDAGALRFRRAFLLFLVAGITVLFLAMVSRFLITIFLAAVVAGVAQPLYWALVRGLGGRRRLAALATLLVLLLGVGLPLAGFLAAVAAQAVQVGQDIGDWLREQAGSVGELEDRARGLPVVGRLLPDRSVLADQIGSLAARTGSTLMGALATATRGTLGFLLQLFVFLYALFYFLTGGAAILRRVLSYTPLSPDEEERLLERFVSVTRATLKGSLLIGVIQGSLAGIAFWAAGVPGAAFWGAVMVVLSIIPAVGAGLVWIPAVIYLFLAGAPVAALALLAWCAVVVGTVDNFLRPRLIGRDARMSDLLILLSTLGGIVLFGAAGFLVGPIIAALFVTIWVIYGEAFREWLPKEPRPVLERGAPGEGAEPEPLS